MIRSTKSMVRIADFFFDEPIVEVRNVDLIRYVQTSEPVDGTSPTPFSTVLVDLTNAPEGLLARVRNNTRYEITRARDRDGLDYEFWENPSVEVINRFSDFFDASAALKGQPPVGRGRLHLLAGQGLLDISVMKRDGTDLVWHAHQRAHTRVRLLETASLFRATADAEFRKVVARANRYHHWRDMMRFKENGTATYDLGGCVPNATDPELQGINRFKEGFGGELVTEYLAARPVTLRGWLALWVTEHRSSLNRLWAGTGSLVKRKAAVS